MACPCSKVEEVGSLGPDNSRTAKQRRVIGNGKISQRGVRTSETTGAETSGRTEKLKLKTTKNFHEKSYNKVSTLPELTESRVYSQHIYHWLTLNVFTFFC